eukprot:Nk52_evm66s2118 gene=Nk52_evmTU66s2118
MGLTTASKRKSVISVEGVSGDGNSGNGRQGEIEGDTNKVVDVLIDVEDGEQPFSKKRFLFGMFLILCVVAIWVGSSELMQFIYSSDDTSFSKPFFLTYYSTAAFTIHLIGFLFKRKWRDDFCAMFSEDKVKEEEKSNVRSGLIGNNKTRNYSSANIADKRAKGVESLSMRETIRVSLIFCVIWFAANYSFNLSLYYTSVSSSTVLSSLSGFFTLILGAIFPSSVLDGFTASKLAVVVMSLCGVIMVTFSDSGKEQNGDGKDGIVGDLISVFSAFLYGCYLTFLKRTCGDEDRINMSQFFGFVGLFNIVLLWPLFLIFHYTGWETFEFPTSVTWGYLTLNSLIGTVLSDYLWFWSTLLTSPLLATLGLALSMPVAIVVDSIMGKVTLSALFVGGAIVVFFGFVFMNLISYYASKREKDNPGSHLNAFDLFFHKLFQKVFWRKQ